MTMRSTEQLSGQKLNAPDGEAGHIRDFLFDAHRWVIRYLVVETGPGLGGRVVLLSPHALHAAEADDDPLRLNVTLKQIRSSPVIDLRKPLTREYEEDYYRHYGWRHYWQGDSLWGATGTPEPKPGPKPLVSRSRPATASASVSAAATPTADTAQPELNSSKAVTGYLLETSDGTDGHVSDFLLDPHSWAVLRLAVRLGHRLSGKEIEIPTTEVEKINWDLSTVTIRLTREGVSQCPTHVAPLHSSPP
ncbi:MAG: hypothetical protein IT580_06000 [Verrucomicrobiales bacterium]|nr:hypothetical protein [Verrucomicrobiales bacterium]